MEYLIDFEKSRKLISSSIQKVNSFGIVVQGRFSVKGHFRAEEVTGTRIREKKKGHSHRWEYPFGS
jgi:hypothetical protein